MLDVPLLLGDILVMGDGDFSYSAALAKLYLEGDGEMHITATSLESGSAPLKYEKASDNLDALQADKGVDVVEMRPNWGISTAVSANLVVSLQHVTLLLLKSREKALKYRATQDTAESGP